MKKLLYLLLFCSIHNFIFGKKNISELKLDLQNIDKVDSNWVNTHNLLAFSYLYKNQDSSKYHAQLALNKGVELRYFRGIAKSKIGLGNLELIKGNYLEALSNYKAALPFGDKKQICQIHNLIGCAELQLKHYSSATKHLMYSLELLETISDSNLLSNTLFYLAMTYQFEDQYELSKEYYEKTLVIKRKLSKSRGIANTLTNLGSLHLSNHNLEDALLCITEAKTIYNELGILEKTAVSTLTLAKIYLEQNRLEKSKYLLAQAQGLIDTAKSRTIFAEIQNTKASIYLKRKHPNKTISHASSALKIAHSSEIILESYTLIHAAYELKGLYKKANYFAKQKISFMDSINLINDKQSAEEIQARYHAQEKQKEIELLNIKNEMQGTTISKSKHIRNIIILLATAFFLLLLITYNRFIIKKKANNDLAAQNSIIEHQKTKITDSINYAKRIQESILPELGDLKGVFADNFIIYKPKDIVSGDFYWFYSDASYSIVVVADCTGHGVPGGFLSMMGYSLLNEIVKGQGIYSPAEILTRLDQSFFTNLKQQKGIEKAQDGMDAVVCTFKKENQKMLFSGASNGIQLVRDNQISSFKGSYRSVGGQMMHDALNHELPPFEDKEIILKSGDCIYLYSDGFIDQFGGEKRKKFSTRKFKNTLLSINHLPMDKQKSTL